MTNIYIIAGEASGDFIASNLVEKLKHQHNLKFFGIGGALLETQGINSLFPIDQINLMGFFEILPHIFKLRALIEQTVQDILAKKIDLLITVDSPGFTYRVAKKLRRLNHNIKMMHIVAPSVWAYKSGRAKKYARIYDQLLAILPFEPSYFIKEGLSCLYIGHPFLSQSFCIDKSIAKAKLGLVVSDKIICVTPGSRKGEIKKHLPVFTEAIEMIAKRYTNLEVIFVINRPQDKDLILEYLDNANYKFSFTNDKLTAFGASNVAIAKSGTNTLEIAASKTPLIIAYKLNNITFWLIKMMLKIRYACLINIIAGKQIIPEFIQNNCSADNIAAATLDLLENNKQAKQQINEADKILRKLGLGSAINPTQKAAQAVMNLIK